MNMFRPLILCTFGGVVSAMGLQACTAHNESQILAMLQYGPMSVSIAAGSLGPYKGGIINCLLF